MSPIQTLMPPSQKGLATAVDLSGVEGGDGVIEGHFFDCRPSEKPTRA
jgi:hypothetical protein